MRSSVVILMTVAMVPLFAQPPATYRITQAYALGGDGGNDYIVPDPPNHRLFIAPAESRDGRRREHGQAARRGHRHQGAHGTAIVD